MSFENLQIESAGAGWENGTSGRFVLFSSCFHVNHRCFLIITIWSSYDPSFFASETWGSLCDLRIARGGEAKQCLHHLQTSIFWRRAHDERHLGQNCFWLCEKQKVWADSSGLRSLAEFGVCWLLVGAIISDNGVLKTHCRTRYIFISILDMFYVKKHFVIHVWMSWRLAMSLAIELDQQQQLTRLSFLIVTLNNHDKCFLWISYNFLLTHPIFEKLKLLLFRLVSLHLQKTLRVEHWIFSSQNPLVSSETCYQRAEQQKIDSIE